MRFALAAVEYHPIRRGFYTAFVTTQSSGRVNSTGAPLLLFILLFKVFVLAHDEFHCDAMSTGWKGEGGREKGGEVAEGFCRIPMDYGSLPLSGFLNAVRQDYGNWNRFIFVIGLRCVEDG